jgi:hypothetical protein
VSRWQPIWLLASFALAVGLNHATRPAADYALSVGERTMSTGKLWLEAGGQRQEFELVTIRVVAQELPRVLAEPLVIRELWLRSREQDGAPPDLELFVDFESGGAGPRVERADELALLRGRDLPIRPRAEGSDARSRVRWHGAAAPLHVQQGRLLIDELVDVGGESQGFRVRGELGLSLEDGERTTPVRGELNARLVW